MKKSPSLLILGFACAVLFPAASALAADCNGLALTQNSAAALSELPLSGPVPASFETIAYGLDAEAEIAEPLLEASPPRVPFYLPDPMTGGAVAVSLTGPGMRCELGMLRIEPLAAAPGKIAGAMTIFRQSATAFEAAFGLSRSASGRIEGWVSDVPPAAMRIIEMSNMVEEITAELGDDPLANAIVARIEQVIGASQPPALDFAHVRPRGDILVAQAFFGAPLLYAPGVQCPENAAQLSGEMDASFQAWAYADANPRAMAAAGLVLSAPGIIVRHVGAAAAGAALTEAAGPTIAGAVIAEPALFAGAITAGAAIPMLNLVRNDIMSKVLLRDIDVVLPKLSRTLIYEDAETLEELTGALLSADVRVRSRGGDIRGAILSLATGFGKLGPYEAWIGVVADQAVAWESGGVFSTEMLSIQPRACSVEVYGSDYIRARVVPPGWPETTGWVRNASITMLDAQRYRAVDVGTSWIVAELVVGRFGDATGYGRAAVDVLELSMNVEPARRQVEPGDSVEVEVTFRNSSRQNPDSDFRIEAGQLSSIVATGANSYRIVTGRTGQSFPLRIRFEPLELTGLMTRPNAPERHAIVTLTADTLAIGVAPFCLEAGETHRFTVPAAWDGDPVRFQADRGHIDATGLYTAPETARGETATVFAMAGAQEASRGFRIGGCTCFWDVTVGGRPYSGYYAYYPVMLGNSIDRDGDGVLALVPLVDGVPGQNDQPIVSEVALQALMINYPRDEAGPGISMTFDPPIRIGVGETKGQGSITSEAAPGIRTDLGRVLTADNIVGTYWLYPDYVDVNLQGEFSRSEDGKQVESRIVTIRARARAGFAPYSACEGPDAPRPGGWLTDAIPLGLPQLPQINR